MSVAFSFLSRCFTIIISSTSSINIISFTAQSFINLLSSTALLFLTNKKHQMANSMDVQIINKETIKPSSPTPLHLRTYHLSSFDQLAPSIYVSFVLFYPSTPGAFCDFQLFLQNFTKSLSLALTHFPQLAGKIKDNVSVDCNDDGVNCYETRVDMNLDELLAHPRSEYLNRLVVVYNNSPQIHTGGQFFAQVNLFKCGGITIGVSFSHKLCDAASFSTFLKCWSTLATNSGNLIVPDLSVTPTSFPAKKDVSIIRPMDNTSSDNCCIARLVFNDSEIKALKAKSANPNTPQPTRVQVVTALIWKCMMTASKANRKSYAMPYIVGHAVNLRKKLTPTLPESAFGNVIGFYTACSEKSDANLDTLVDSLGKAKLEYDDFMSKLDEEQVSAAYAEGIEKAGGMLRTEVLEVYFFSSWCRFPLYEADFSLGKPIWIGNATTPYKNVSLLMDAKDGNGIEAYVCLSKGDMTLFESDPLLLAYASLNSRI